MAKSAQARRVYTPSTSGAVRDRRPGHSSHRTVRGVDRSDHPHPSGRAARWPWPASHGHRRRAGLSGRCPGPAALPRRAPLAAGRTLPGRAPVPPAAVPARLQPSPAAGGRPDGGRAAVAGRPHPGHRRAAAAAGRHPGGVWPLADHGHPVGPGRLGRLRPRHLPPLLLLGRPAAAGLYPRRDGDRIRAGQPQTGGRTPGGAGHAGGRPGQPAGTWHAAGRRQGLCRPRLPDRPGRPGPCDPASGPHRRARGWGLSQLAAAAGRGDHLDPQAPARPGPPGRPHPRRAVGAGGAAPARPQCRDLVQLADRRPGQAVPDCLRPLKPPSPAPKTASTI